MIMVLDFETVTISFNITNTDETEVQMSEKVIIV
jgi:hypothetical protein